MTGESCQADRRTLDRSLFAEALGVRLRLRKAHDFRAFLELPALLQELDALETFQDIPLRRDGAGAFETAMLRHNELSEK